MPGKKAKRPADPAGQGRDESPPGATVHRLPARGGEIHLDKDEAIQEPPTLPTRRTKSWRLLRDAVVAVLFFGLGGVVWEFSCSTVLGNSPARAPALVITVAAHDFGNGTLASQYTTDAMLIGSVAQATHWSSDSGVPTQVTHGHGKGSRVLFTTGNCSSSRNHAFSSDVACVGGTQHRPGVALRNSPVRAPAGSITVSARYFGDGTLVSLTITTAAVLAGSAAQATPLSSDSGVCTQVIQVIHGRGQVSHVTLTSVNGSSSGTGAFSSDVACAGGSQRSSAFTVDASATLPPAHGRAIPGGQGSLLQKSPTQTASKLLSPNAT